MKPNTSDSHISGLDAPLGTFTNVALASLIAYAYAVPYDQVSGGPAWVKVDRFDLKGKMSDTDAAIYNNLGKRQQERQSKLMLQQMLADRFALRISHQPKEVSGYALVIAKNGPKLRPSGHGDTTRMTPCGDQGCAMMITDPHGTTGNLTELSASVLGRPVVDATGLSGTYDISFGVPNPETNEGQQDISTSMRDSLKEQLGLELEPRRVLADTIRIESVDRPSPN